MSGRTSLHEAVQNLLDDVDELRREDLRLHDLELRIGARFLGFGGGFNHEDDLRAALASVEAVAVRDQGGNA